VRTSVFVGTSLDGFIARHDNTFDFLSGTGEVDGESNGYNAFFATVDAVLMGRNTFEVALRFPIWPYRTTPVFVLSTHPLPVAPEGAIVELTSGTPRAVLSQLASRGFQHVYVDGGITVQQFLRAGCVDRIVVTRIPVLIGSGIPLFGALDADLSLEHVATRVLAGGAVQSEYVPRRTSPETERFAQRMGAGGAPTVG
jgi:dihydrofolate reductase